MSAVIIRVLKPRGIFYFNAPSNGDFHRWSKDCWRFYPDSGNALVNWAKKNNFNSLQLEAYTSKQILENGWSDYVSIVLKDSQYLNEFNDRVIFNYNNFLKSFIHLNFLKIFFLYFVIFHRFYLLIIQQIKNQLIYLYHHQFGF